MVSPLVVPLVSPTASSMVSPMGSLGVPTSGTSATSGSQPPADLSRVFFLQLSVVGSTMGTRDELERLVAMCQATGLRPLIDHELPLSAADEALRHIASGDLFGKIVLTRD